MTEQQTDWRDGVREQVAEKVKERSAHARTAQEARETVGVAEARVREIDDELYAMQDGIGDNSDGSLDDARVECCRQEVEALTVSIGLAKSRYMTALAARANKRRAIGLKIDGTERKKPAKRAVKTKTETRPISSTYTPVAGKDEKPAKKPATKAAPTAPSGGDTASEARAE